MGKVVASTLKEQIKEAAGPLQTCASHGAGAEAAIHSMREIFEKEETDGVLLIDASNAFNNMNRAAALHNIQIQCPSLSKYIINQYRKESRLSSHGVLRSNHRRALRRETLLRWHGTPLLPASS